MLDTDTKRRIDTARDILVGKVPDPKSQVEQITIALIYKFMADTDAEAEELGGKRQFFADDFARYGWAKLTRSGLGGHETLNLYAEAIAKMPENPGIPPLFRDIFKNAYLPYRDPETLRAFLKIIDEFTYDHSERLGDAFEYLLSVLGSQGDAGQFRTPRHIIDFIVAIVDPKKTETVLDPACGTAGFLISSYKHILKANADKEGHNILTPDERGRLAANFKGYDISPDMVRLSLVNMYLHGFTDPHIYEYDTLTSQDRWNDYADVILANPPFMSPRGGIRPHNRFSVQSKRSEVLFLDYMAEHLAPGGRAGIIVPEGIIFQSQTAYTQLRSLLVDDYLIGVISLPSGVFMPYTGVKTSILVLDRSEARRNPNLMFSDVRQIGLSLGVKRTPTNRNDLPYIQRDYRAYYNGSELSRHSWLASREEILANECNLTGSRYKPKTDTASKRFVTIGEICQITRGSSSSTKTPPGPYRLVLTAAESKTSDHYQFERPAVCVPIISSLGHGRAALHRIHYAEGQFALANLLVALQPTDPEKLDVRFLYHALDARRNAIAGLMQGAANVGLKPQDLANFEIPLPLLEVQKEIVAKIEAYRKVIDGAHAVLDNYRPHIRIQTDWPMVELSKVARLINGRSFKQEELLSNGPTPVLRVGNLFSNRSWYYSDLELDENKYCNEGDLLYAWSASFGPRIWEGPRAIFHYHIWKIETSAEIEKKFLFHILEADSERIKMEGNGIAMMHATKRGMEQWMVPLPALAVQQQIVAEIEAEESLVAVNRELVTRFERKAQVALSRLWGEGEAV